jgi:hypothetical protein
MDWITTLKEISPFLAIVVSLVALIAGPYFQSKVARQQSLSMMKEKWIYMFRDTLVELTTKLDVLHEFTNEHGFSGTPEYERHLSELSALQNRINFMVNSGEDIYKDLLKNINDAVVLVLHGIEDYQKFHNANDKIKELGQRAVRHEWKKV